MTDLITFDEAEVRDFFENIGCDEYSRCGYSLSVVTLDPQAERLLIEIAGTMIKNRRVLDDGRIAYDHERITI